MSGLQLKHNLTKMTHDEIRALPYGSKIEDAQITVVDGHPLPAGYVYYGCKI